MQAMRCALIGMPGSGKTTVGRQLARQWHLPFIDSDHVIEQRLGCTIKQYFAEHGEAAFRDVEQQVLAELLAATAPCVLSTGGGSVLRAALGPSGEGERSHSGARHDRVAIMGPARMDSLAPCP